MVVMPLNVVIIIIIIIIIVIRIDFWLKPFFVVALALSAFVTVACDLRYCRGLRRRHQGVYKNEYADPFIKVLKERVRVQAAHCGGRGARQFAELGH